MNRLHGLWLVAGREIRETTRRKSFWIVLAVLALGSTAAMVIPALLDDDGDRAKLGVVDVRADLGRAIVATLDQLDIDARLVEFDDPGTARRAVRDERVDLAVVGAEPVRVVVRSDTGSRLSSGVRQALAVDAIVDRLGDEGVSDAAIVDALSIEPPELVVVDGDGDSRRGAAFAVSLVLYILLLTLMVQVANAVAVEKSNRISEVLLAIVRPSALLFGKVIGVAVLGTATLGAAVVPVVVRLGFGNGLPPGLGGAVLGGAAWFVLGLALYSTIAGALGALVERQEEAGSIVSPMTAVLVGALIAAQSAADSTLGVVLAYVPLTSPLMMPSRLAMGLSGPGEVVVSLGLGVLAVAVAVRVGGVVYARAIVRTGRRLKLREVLSSTK